MCIVTRLGLWFIQVHKLTFCFVCHFVPIAKSLLIDFIYIIDGISNSTKKETLVAQITLAQQVHKTDVYI